MKKKLIVLSTTIIMGLGSVFSISTVNAESANLKKIQDQRSGLQTDISKTYQEILQIQNEYTKLSEQITRVELAIKDNNKMIVQTEEKVKESQFEVKTLQQELTTIQERINKRNELLKKRALSLQVSGKVSYIDIILGASGFSDFVSRLGAIATMVEADQDLVTQHIEDQKEIEKKQSSVVKKLNDLQNLKTELVGMQAQILEQKEQNDALKEDLKLKEQEKLALMADLQIEDGTLASKEAQIKGNTYKDDTKEKNKINVLIPTTSNETTNIVIHAGDKYIGNSVYVFGGGRNSYDVEHGRFDCSGFVAWAFKQAGINVGAHTDILKNTGTRVSMSEAQPGDLVFFDTYKIDGHVGIYLGGGKFIGSQSSTGIAIADLTSGFYKKKFNGRVMRIISDKP
ncbi:coiled-coil domain-containing protein [Neobacillus drentensis]|uniref:coiled-coil domain-containing protein n=1 Tax=Neobacillus drentensis TaxID=220684 RepID=UPI00285C8F0C|nr:NlpC/P60 family protein [Neobacillus drentensis]MDR7236039.1 peptidoglycan hydrolase CwlO-like protein [Neobacillus drentensis]